MDWLDGVCHIHVSGDARLHKQNGRQFRRHHGPCEAYLEWIRRIGVAGNRNRSQTEEQHQQRCTHRRPLEWICPRKTLSSGYSPTPIWRAIQGATTFSKILPSGHSAERPMCPPPGLTQASLGEPACSNMSRSAIGTWVSLSPLTSSIGAEGRPIRPWFFNDIRGPKARNSSSDLAS